MSFVATPTLEIRSLRALNGPNIWSKRPVLEGVMDVSNFSLNDWAAADALLTSQGISGTQAAVTWSGPSEARAVAWLGEATVKIQTAGHTPAAFHTWRPTANPKIIRLAVEYREEAVGKAALDLAIRWLRALSVHDAFDFAQEWETFRDFAYDIRLGNSTGPTVEAAEARGIPYLRLDSESLVQLGQGCRRRWIRMAATDRTSHMANEISTDKELTKTLLREIGVPVPRGRPVSDAEDACVAAREAGWPVVVKPQDGDYGAGVTTLVTTEEGVRRAYAWARESRERVLVEHHVAGGLFRLLVVGGRLVAAIHREPTLVVGDGHSTVLELIEAANHDPRRGSDYVSPFQKTLQETGEMPPLTDPLRPYDSVPALGETVPLRHNVYLKCGGAHIDQTEIVHSEIAALVIDATSGVGLDIAGLDVIATDLAKSPDEQEFAVLEVNSEPSISLHLDPLCTPSQPVGEAIVDWLFPSPEASRIPVIAVLGQASDFSVAQEIALKQQAAHRQTGLASKHGAWLNDRPLGDACQSVVQHARRLWRHPRTEVAIIHVTLEDVLREGLPFDRCDELIECASDSQALESPDASPEDLDRARDCIRATLTSRVPIA